MNSTGKRENNPPQRRAQRPQQKKTGSKVAAFLIILFTVIGIGLGVFHFWWTTHAVFEYNLQPVVIVEGADVRPSDFLIEHGEIEAEFTYGEFEPVSGVQTVPLSLTYGLRSLETTARLYVLTPISQIVTEFAEHMPDLVPIEMISNADIASGIPFDVRFSEQPQPLSQFSVGEHSLNLELNGAPFVVWLMVVDTTPPTATPVEMSIIIGEDAFVDDFVTDIFDASEIVSVEFVREPDVFLGQDQVVEVEIIDAFNNSFLVSTVLRVEVNAEPPTIDGTQVIHSMVGSPILFRQGVTAFDDFGRELEFYVDTAEVDQHTVGVYTVIYWAEDLTGNRTEIEVEVHVIDVDPEYVDSRVDEIIEGILNDDMTQVEKARAILRWVRSNVSYAAEIRGGPASVYEGAYRALRDRRGNCYIFFSISDRLLTRAGIPTMRISRAPGLSATNHHWNLINPDGLGWHHFDSMPTRFDWSPQMYMFTQSQAERFAVDLIPVHGGPHYFTFDPDLFPPIVP